MGLPYIRVPQHQHERFATPLTTALQLCTVLDGRGGYRLHATRLRYIQCIPLIAGLCIVTRNSSESQSEACGHVERLARGNLRGQQARNKGFLG